eukprot:gene3789-15073_t
MGQRVIATNQKGTEKNRGFKEFENVILTQEVFLEELVSIEIDHLSDADLSAKLLQLISQAGKTRNGGQENPEKVAYPANNLQKGAVNLVSQPARKAQVVMGGAGYSVFKKVLPCVYNREDILAFRYFDMPGKYVR